MDAYWAGTDAGREKLDAELDEYWAAKGDDAAAAEDGGDVAGGDAAAAAAEGEVEQEA
jgi:hypothetical protein